MRNRESAYKAIPLIVAVLVHLFGTGYTGYHNFRLMAKGVQGEGAEFALAGVLANELTLIGLIFALHYWALEGVHRLSAWAFYGVTWLIVIMNTIANFDAQAGAKLPGWVSWWVTWVVPVTPIICVLGWAAVVLLDPQVQVRMRKFRNHLQSRLTYEEARATFAEEDAMYRAEIESAAFRDQLDEARRAFNLRGDEPLLQIRRHSQPYQLPPAQGQEQTDKPATSTNTKGTGAKAQSPFDGGDWFSLNFQQGQSHTFKLAKLGKNGNGKNGQHKPQE